MNALELLLLPAATLLWFASSAGAAGWCTAHWLTGGFGRSLR